MQFNMQITRQTLP